MLHPLQPPESDSSGLWLESWTFCEITTPVARTEWFDRAIPRRERPTRSANSAPPSDSEDAAERGRILAEHFPCC